MQKITAGGEGLRGIGSSGSSFGDPAVGRGSDGAASDGGDALDRRIEEIRTKADRQGGLARK
jgi:hypothetical protein